MLKHMTKRIIQMVLEVLAHEKYFEAFLPGKWCVVFFNKEGDSDKAKEENKDSS